MPLCVFGRWRGHCAVARYRDGCWVELLSYGSKDKAIVALG